jgi:hypothetical protein
MSDQLETLLVQVAAISKKYEEIAKLTGENFNVFRILKLTTNEVRTHSAFIAELLDPKGCHDQGDVFLKLFVDCLFKSTSDKFEKTLIEDEKNNTENDLKILGDLKSKACKVYVEKYIGGVSNDYEDGGRIDILVTDNNAKAIIIENKIYAQDQKNQLLRYHNYGKKFHPDKFLLYYLTLDGSEPSDWSKGIDPNKKENELTGIKFQKISYKIDILGWLEECKEKAVNHPLLRETITQYINLIKYLTNQTINNKMSIDIANQMIRSEESLKASFDIVNNMSEARKLLIGKLNEKLKDLAHELGLEIHGWLTADRYSKIWFYKANWTKSQIVFGFEAADFNNFWKGIGKGQNNEKYLEEEEIKTKICKELSEKDIPVKDENYAWCAYSDGLRYPRNWSIDNVVWLNILNKNEEFYGRIKEDIKDLSDVLDRIYPK